MEIYCVFLLYINYNIVSWEKRGWQWNIAKRDDIKVMSEGNFIYEDF